MAGRKTWLGCGRGNISKIIMATFSNLPTETIVQIFKNIALHDLVDNCSRTCLRWREIIALFLVRPRIQRLGWKEETNDIDLILSGYQKYELRFSKCHTYIFIHSLFPHLKHYYIY